MPAPEVISFNWRVSQKCEGGACVSVGNRGKFILVRDIKHPDGPFVDYTAAAWEEFVDSIKKDTLTCDMISSLGG